MHARLLLPLLANLPGCFAVKPVKQRAQWLLSLWWLLAVAAVVTAGCNGPGAVVVQQQPVTCTVI